MLDQLSQFGLTETQAKVYYHLLKLGTSPATKITKEVGVHRVEVYRALRELAEKGIVTEHKGKRPSLFTSVPPDDAISILLQHQTETFTHLRDLAPKLIAWLNSQTKVAKVRPSVLLIDDDETIRRMLAGTLVREGFKVDTAADGRGALEKSRLNHYDIALLDIRLPDLDGTTLIRKLRKGNPGMKEIVITGYPSVENAARAMDEGADAYLTKPVKMADLLTKIAQKLRE